MIAYHGSDANFKQLRISKSLVKHRTTLENEGLGIYFSTDKEIARSYGKYMYTLKINNKYLKDFRNQTTCEKYLIGIADTITKSININILNYIKFQEFVQRMCYGGISIASTCKDIYDILENTETWYSATSKSRREIAYKILRKYDKNHLFVYLFKYNIPNVGVIKTIDENVVTIINKENSY